MDDAKIAPSGAPSGPEAPQRGVPGAKLGVALALILAPFSPVTWYAGGAVALLLIVVAIGVVLAGRPFRVRGLVIGASIALAISVGVTFAWETFVNTASEVDGDARIDQRKAFKAFDQAFDDATARPGETDAGPGAK